MARGAPPRVLEDATPLNGATIDVMARAGWTIRMARLTAAPDHPTLEQLAERIGTSPARLHRMETGALRDGALTDAYEAALGLVSGSLRAPIDILCRTFPQDSAPDRNPDSTLRTVQAVSAATDRVWSDATPGADDWLVWARALAHPGAVGMPERVALPLIDELIGELNRSVGSAYHVRYEALSLLRCSGYGHLVLEAARERVADPHVQVLLDMFSAVGEAVSPDAVQWCLDLLDDPRDEVLVGTVLSLENMGQITGPGFWVPIVDDIVTRFNATRGEGPRWEWMSHLVRTLPTTVRQQSNVTLSRTPSPAARMDDWTRTRLNRHWSEALDRSDAVTRELGIPSQPLLARLLFDIAFSPFEARAVTSYMLLGALPEISTMVASHLADMAQHDPDAVLRDRIGRRLPGLVQSTFPEFAQRWLDSEDLADRNRALMLAGLAGKQMDDDLLWAAVHEGGDALRAAMYSAGMSAHPLLARLAEDPEVGGLARWWQVQGSRLVR